MKKNILYVDDNSNDTQLVERAIGRENFAADVFSVGDGCAAGDWLIGDGIYSDRDKYPLPDVLIVDLRMPGNSGLDLLEFVRARRELKKLVMIVYTDSEDPEDKLRAFQLGANAYVTKTNGTDALLYYVRSAVMTLPREIEGEQSFV